MKLYIKQKVFSWGDKFRVYDEEGNDVYFVRGEVFSLGKKLHIYDANEQEAAFIHQKLLSFLPRFFINAGGEEIAEVIKKFTLFRHEYEVRGPEWTVKGDFLAHEYEITAGETVAATVSKQWFAWGDTYEINVSDNADVMTALCTVLIIDAVIAQQRNTVAFSSGNN